MASDTDPANLISKAKPDCQRSGTNATRSTRYHVTHTASQTMTRSQRHSQPATQASHDTQPASYSMAGHSTAHRQAGPQPGKESIFYREAGRHHPPAPPCPTRAAPNAENPSSQKNTTFMQSHASSQKNSLFLPLLPYAATLTSVNKML
jgi:hypothetical protein